jgi:hypothetical protein
MFRPIRVDHTNCLQVDIKTHSFIHTDRDLTLDVLSGHASRDYVCDLRIGDVIPTCDNLSKLFGYFKES